MTVPEALERLEALTLTLATCANSSKQRESIEVQMTRCYRIIQRAQQRAHQSLASVATVLLEINRNAAVTEQKGVATIAAAHLIRCASTEQLAVAVAAAIHETPSDSTPLDMNKFPESASIVSPLLTLDGTSLSFAERVAVRTALHLINIAERRQIHHSMRRAQACRETLGPNGIWTRLNEIYAGYRPKQGRGSGVAARSKRVPSLNTCAAVESLR